MIIWLRRFSVFLLLLAPALAAPPDGDEAGPPPEIRTQPRHTTVFLGDDASFQVVATSSTFISYQWYFRGTALQGATSAQLTVPNVRVRNVGDYWVELMNVAGTTRSSNATLSVRVVRDFIPIALGGSDSRVFNAVPPDPTAIIDCGLVNDSTLWVGLRSDQPGTCVVDTSGSQGDTFLQIYRGEIWPGLALLECDDNSGPDGISGHVRFPMEPGINYVVAVDLANTSKSVPVTVNWRYGIPPRITQQPLGRTAVLGEAVDFFAAAEGIPPPRFQWFKDDKQLPEQTNSLLHIPEVKVEHAGIYRLEARNGLGTESSNDAELMVHPRARLHALGWRTNGFRFSVTGPPGVYDLHASPDLRQWIIIATTNVTESTWEFVDEQAPQFFQRYYRVSPR